MGNIKIIRGMFDTLLKPQQAGVKAGLPSPADYIRHPEASSDGDRVKALEARPLTTSTSSVRGRWLTASTACTAQRPWPSVPSNTHEKTARAKQTHLPTPRSTFLKRKNPTTRWSDVTELK